MVGEVTATRGGSIDIRLPAVGEVFQGRYEIFDLLGRGGFASVFRARDLSMSREVAIKVLSPDDGEYNKTAVARFLREAQVIASLEDPHTVTMYDFGQSAEGLLYMVFELVRGDDLSEVVARGRARRPTVVIHILSQLLSALREAHDRGVFHRDIKPANILMYEYGGDAYRVKLIDFGIAKEVGSDATSITRTGRIVGTPRYMAPEQLFGQPMGADCDIYSLGLVGFELLTGAPAIAGESNKEVLQQQVSPEPLLLPEQVAPASLRRVLERMVARDRTERYQSAAAAARDLRALQAEASAWEATAFSSADHRPDQAPDAPPRRAPTLPPRPVPQAPRSSLRGTLVAVAAFLAAVAIWAQMFFTGDTEPAPAQPARDVSGLLASRAASRLPEPVPVEREPVAAASDDLPTDGCAAPARDVGGSSMQRPSGTRNWRVYLPPSYTGATRLPLLMMFHRSWSSAEGQLAETKMETLADEKGFVIFAFDDGPGIPWDTEEDFDYVMEAIDYGRKTLCLDRSRFYAFGEGQGGEFANRLACAMPLSAIAMSGHGENIHDRPCVPQTPTPRLRLYGLEDRHVPAEGGKGCVPLMAELRSADEIDALWAANYNCTEPAHPWGKRAGGSCHIRSCDAAIVTCATQHGHYWPGVDPPSFDLPTCEAPVPSKAFPYLEALWTFFEEHGRHVPAEEAP